MFGNLDKFAAADYWKEHKTVLFQTIQGTYAYEIVAVMKTDVSVFPFQQAEFSGETGLLEYVRQAKSLGLFGTGELCGDPEQVLTLVSCSYEWESARNVVVAVRKPEVPVA
nr:class B sortase [Enterocloster clostridioformis]